MQTAGMTQLWFYTLGSVVAISLVSLVGLILLAFRRRDVSRTTPYLISLAVGTLLGGAALHLMPLALRQSEGEGLDVWLLFIAGFVGSFILEKFLRVHRAHDHGSAGAQKAGGRRSLTGMILIGDGIHNLLDGAIIAASYAAGAPTGAIATLAVFLHEIPQEIGDFGALIHAGLSPKMALLLNFLSGLTAMVGALLTLWLGTAMQGAQEMIVPLAAGNFLYIAAADLVPELHQQRGVRKALWQVALVSLGVGLAAGVHLVRESLH